MLQKLRLKEKEKKMRKKHRTDVQADNTTYRCAIYQLKPPAAGPVNFSISTSFTFIFDLTV